MSLKLLAALVAALAVTVAIATQPIVNRAEAQSAGGGMTLTVRNVTAGNPLTPPIAVVHDGSARMAKALEGLAGLEELAEAGMQDPLAASLAGVSGVSEVVKFAPSVIPGGQQAGVDITATSGDYVTVVSMLACANDAITVGTVIVSDGGMGMSGGRVYDAGTEANDETEATVPCLMGEGVSDAGGEGSISRHAGIIGRNDLSVATHGWDYEAMRLFVHAAGSDAPASATAMLTVENLTAGQPITPPVAVVHDPNIAALLYESPSDLAGIDDLAEGGVTGDLIATLRARAGVVSVVGLNSGGPIGPGSSFTTSVDGVDGAAVSVVGMFACTNDGYVLASAPLNVTGGMVAEASTIAAVIDSGSEANDETMATVPCLGGAAAALSEGLGEGMRAEHAGIEGGADLDTETHGWTADATARLTLSDPLSDPAAYTKVFVQQAIDRYGDTGLTETARYYNTAESRLGQWYVFISDDRGITVAHPALVGTFIDDAVGPNGYPIGKAIKAVADADGEWIDYTYLNPVSGEVETKRSWVVLRDGNIFGSGWYEPGPSKSDPATYTQAFVQQALNLYDAAGRDTAIDYYGSRDSVDDDWYVFIVDADSGTVIAHPTIPENIGQSLLGDLGVDSTGYVFGPLMLDATEAGVWVDYKYLNPAAGEEGSKHAWLVRSDDLIFGSGWYEPYSAPPTPTPAPEVTPDVAPPATGDYTLPAGWALVIGLAGLGAALAGAVLLTRQRGRRRASLVSRP